MAVEEQAIDLELLERETAPPPVTRSAWRWARQHLFSSVFNTILTILAASFVVVVVRGILSFILSSERVWGAVTINMRLYMVFAYPEEQMGRVWLSLAVVAGLIGLSVAAWGSRGEVPVAKLIRRVTALGGFVIVLAVLAPISAVPKLIGTVAGLVLVLSAQTWRRALGPRSGTASIPTQALLGALLALVVAALWILQVPFPVEQRGPGDIVHEWQPLARSTTVPLTILAGIAAGAYLIGRRIRGEGTSKRFRLVLVVTWLLSYPTIVFGILRNPIISLDQVLTRDVPLALGFAIGGGALLYWLAGVEERARTRVVGLGVAFVALASWLLQVEGVVRIPLVLLAIFTLVTPSFSGTGPAARRIAFAWGIAVIALISFMSIMDTSSGIFTQKRSFLGGFILTLVLALGGVIPGFILSIPLALARTSKLPLLRQLSIAYIEIIRGVPLIVWLFMGVTLFSLFVPPGLELDVIFKVAAVFTLFWAAYLAENVRGGLQAIPRGQIEAAQAVGMSPIQVTFLIVLPQALRTVIPPIVGQVITSFKDTSLVAIIGVFELLNIAHAGVPNQTEPFVFLGTRREGFLFVALVYWVFTFTLSRASQRLEKKLGVGER